VHGNASFNAQYLLRAAAEAADEGGGIVLLHSHPLGLGWQSLSQQDRAAESGIAAQALALTDLPLVGMTFASDGTWSARFWHREAPKSYVPSWCETVRVVGQRFAVSFNDNLVPAPVPTTASIRTREALGDVVFGDLTRLRVGIIGAGNIGAQIGESLARTGFLAAGIMDFDTAKFRNLDRTLHTYPRDVLLRRAKSQVLVRAMRRSAIVNQPQYVASELSVCEPEGFAEALDFDVIFCCVDRPWARQVCNLLAYAHLIPVVDGGVDVDVGGGRLRDARMRAHLAAPGRQCLSCIGQYDAGLVQLDRDGSLDSADYRRNLPAASVFLRGANVYGFGVIASGMEFLQLVVAFVGPSGRTDIGTQTYVSKLGTVRIDDRGGQCLVHCAYATEYLARADNGTPPVTGGHPAAVAERAARVRARRRLGVRVAERLERMAAAATAAFDRVLVRVLSDGDND
jgi:molybdopterin-synthase adenylyltransferase